MTWTLLTLAAGTLVSEDLTLLAAGLLVADGRIGLWDAMWACLLGIFIGDLLVYAGGRLVGPRVLAWPRVARVLPPAHVALIRSGLNRRLGWLIAASRFAPGTRFALYVTCGALRASPRTFALWCGAAAMVWTPLIVLGSAQARLLASVSAWVTQLAVVSLVLAALLRLQRALRNPVRRARMVAAISRIWRWEFWPMWLFYAPVAVWIALLIVRHRGVAALAAANPGMPDGGIVGESKSAILHALPAQWTVPTLLVAPGAVAGRLARLAGALRDRAWQFPLVFKPDVGERGRGVTLVRTLHEAEAYFGAERRSVVVQPFHPGPFEAGVFYYRRPSWPRGRILSITDKHFPTVTGDGRSTLEQLIWGDSRLRMQARTFLSRLGDGRHRVPSAGERVTLGMAGNHCQGALFRDGGHLITPALEDRIDAIARAYEGFFVGRFDIRYSNVDLFKAGQDIAIIELNGTTAESTNIYDPGGSLLSAYRQLFVQWSLVFAIGAANRQAGAPSLSASVLLRRLLAHQGGAAAWAHAD